MNKRSASDTELAIECITYLGYLDKQARYQDAVVNLRNLLGDSSVLNEIQDPQSLKSLVVLCNKYACRLFKESKFAEGFELLEQGKLILDSGLLDKDEELRRLKLSVYNNLSIYAYKIGKHDVALNFINSALGLTNSSVPDLYGACYNNMAVINFKKQKFEEATQKQKKGLAVLEKKIYEEIKVNSQDKAALKQNKEFLLSLNVMLNGYLNLARFLNVTGKKEDKLQPEKIYQNGSNLSKAFLGSDNELTKRFKSQSAKNSTKFAEKSQTKPEIPNHTRQKSQVDLHIETSRIQKDSPECLSRRKSKEFIIKSTSGTFLTPRTSEKTNKGEQDAEYSINRSIRREKVQVSLPVSRRQSVSEDHRKKLYKSSSIEISRDNLQVTRTNSPSEINIDKLLEEKIEQSLRKIREGEIDLAKYQKKMELDLEIKQLQKEIEEARIKKEKKLKKIEKLSITAKNLENSVLENHGSSYYRPYTGPMYMPYYAVPVGSMHPMPFNFGYPVMHPEKPNTSVIGNKGSLTVNDEEYPGLNSQTSIKSSDANSNSKKNTSLNGSQADFSTKLEKSDKTAGDSSLTAKRLDIRQEALGARSQTSSADFGQALQTNPPTPTSSARTNRTNEAPADSNRSRKIHIEEMLPGPICKAETFGTGALGQLIGEFKKSVALKRSPVKAEVPDTGLEVINEKNRTLSTTGMTSTHLGEMSTTKTDINPYNRASINIKSETNFLPSTILGNEPGNHHAAPEDRSSSTLLQVPNEKVASSIIFRETLADDPRLKETSRSVSIYKDSDHPPRPSYQTKKSGPLIRRESINLSIDSKLLSVATKIFPSISKIDFEFDDKQEITSPLDWHDNSIVQEDMIQPRPSIIFDLPDHMSTLETSTVRQMYFGINDGSEYSIECHFVSQYIDPKIRIVLNQRAPGQRVFSPVAEENVKIKDLKMILQLIEYRDVIPASLPIKCLKDYGKLINHFVLPFVWIAEGEDRKKRIEIRAKARGLLPESNECTFLKERCRISINAIGGTKLRVVLDGLNNEKNKSLRFDVIMDVSSFDQYFEALKFTKTQNMAETIVKVLDTLVDDTVGAGELDETCEAIKNFGDEKSMNQEKKAYRFKGKKEEDAFMDMFLQILTTIEKFLADKGIDSISKASDPATVKYMRVRFYQRDSNKKDFVLMVENPEKNEFKVHLKNLYETHAPENKKVMAEGVYSYNFEQLWKDFGVHYSMTDREDRLALCSVIAEFFRLEVFDKPLTPIDYPAFKNNMIFRCPLEYGCFERIYEGDTHKNPITCSLVGVKGHPIGVKATSYNPQDRLEQGVFFLIDPENWRKPPQPIVKNSKALKFADLPMCEDYYLVSVLKPYGFKIIKEFINFENSSKGVRITGLKLAEMPSCIDVLENPLSFPNFVKYLKTKTDLLEPFDELMI